ncbi:hypothetical protein [Thorsellia anophelis]|uniref:Uncharacterized protein n=1 Tax=Thorsellia anophelis DSM 18579 TaxID=1123402 RepID=A0A1I0CV16_9GAMM|nr:hypothetical protein [Thorsellia anophelis]SET23671.1 hypothetical protein SAMN02583745_01759 [Thorsellia anophelis DSM 18579]
MNETGLVQKTHRREKRKKPVCRNRCANKCFTESDEARRMGICKKCYYRYLKKKGREHEIPSDYAETIPVVRVNVPKKGSFVTKKHLRISCLELSDLAKLPNHVTVIERHLKNKNSLLDVDYLVNKLVKNQDVNDFFSQVEVGEYYSKLFTTSLWLQVKRECEDYRKLISRLIIIDYQDFVLGYFLLKLDSIILERKVSHMIEMTQNISCKRGIYSYINIVVDPRTANILPNKILKTCNEIINNESCMYMNFEFGDCLKERYSILKNTSNVCITENFKRIVFKDNFDNDFFLLVAYRISIYEMSNKFNLKNYKAEYLPLTEIACFNNGNYFHLVNDFILKAEFDAFFIESLSFLFLIRITMAIRIEDVNAINEKMKAVIASLTYSINSNEFISILKKQLSLLRKFMSKDYRIINNKEVFSKLFNEIINQKKIRVIKKKSGEAAKNIVKYDRQFNELKKISQPIFTILGKELYYVPIEHGSTPFKKYVIEYKSEFDFCLSPIIDNTYLRLNN